MGSPVDIALGAGAAGLGFFGNLVGASSNRKISENNLEAQREANKTNLQISRETNQSNYDLWKAQNDQAWKMLDSVNQYNTPVNQASRFSAAGINPQLAMSGQNSGSASAVSLPSASPMQPARVDPVRQDYVPPALAKALESLGNVPSQYAAMSSALSRSQIDSAAASVAAGTSQYKIEQEMARLKGMIENNDLTKATRLKAWTEYQYYDTFMKNRNLQQEMQYNLTSAEYERTVAQTVKTYAEADSAAMIAKFQKAGFKIQLEQLDATLRETYARVANLVASKNLTVQQTKKAVQDTFISVLQSEGMRLDNEQKRELLPYVVKSSIENLNKVINEVGVHNKAWSNHGLYRGLYGAKNFMQGLVPFSSIVGALK